MRTRTCKIGPFSSCLKKDKSISSSFSVSDIHYNITAVDLPANPISSQLTHHPSLGRAPRTSAFLTCRAIPLPLSHLLSLSFLNSPCPSLVARRYVSCPATFLWSHVFMCFGQGFDHRRCKNLWELQLFSLEKRGLRESNNTPKERVKEKAVLSCPWGSLGTRQAALASNCRKGNISLCWVFKTWN